MKILIGAACICIIAATGYFGWSEYRAATAETRAAEEQYNEALAIVEAEARQAAKKAADPLPMP